MYGSIKVNAAQSPLLRLPGEIRDRIFRLVLGEKTVHIYQIFDGVFKVRRWSSNGRIYHRVCVASQSEDELYENFSKCKSEKSTVDCAATRTSPFQQRHDNCYSVALQLDLNLLSSCRQIYEEANFLLWTTNTFAFARPWALRSFVDRLNFAQRKKLCSIHIDKSWASAEMDPWSPIVTTTFMKKLGNLQKVQLTYWTRRRTPPYPNSVNIEGKHAKDTMCSLKALPLKEVTVIISETRDDTYEERWSLTERQEKAEDIRRQLLDPNGHEIHAVEVEGLKARRKIEREEAAEAWRHGDHTRDVSMPGTYSTYDHDVYDPEYGGLPDFDSSPPPAPTGPRYTNGGCEELDPDW